MQNKANFRNDKMMQAQYSQGIMNKIAESGHEKTNPIQTQLKPKQTQYKANLTQNKPNSNPILFLLLSLTNSFTVLTAITIITTLY